MLGASAVQLGTAFMRCAEANMYDALANAVCLDRR
jgi:NAD(P)H-dependent flavin oxidoreductase YrpB (nitropropane dioxygenase family)